MKPAPAFPALLFSLLLTLPAPAQTKPNPLIPAGAAMAAFANGGSREDFLNTLKSLEPQSPLDQQLIDDLSKPDKPPTGYNKKPEDRTQEERIRALIFDLRDMTGDALPHTTDTPSPAERLVAIGYPAMDLLLESADDRTPTRATPSYVSTPALPTLFRRGQLITQIIGRIAALRSAVSSRLVGNPDQLRRWWKEARGKSQADGLRLWMKQNQDQGYVSTLALIEGTEDEIKTLRALQAANLNQYGNQITETLNQLDRRSLVHSAMERFWQLKTTRFDLSYVARFGDQRVYAEIARHIENGAEADLWAKDLNGYLNTGGPWAIPAHVAIVTRNAAATDSISAQATNHAMAELTRLTGQEFGYQADASSSTPQPAAYEKLKDWWQTTGKETMAPKINEARPSPTAGTDLLDTDDQILVRLANLASTNPITARRAVTSLPKSFSSEVQRALLTRLATEALPVERKRILDKFATASPWQAPQLAALLENDPDESVRLAAADLIAKTMGKSTIDWTLRLEPRATALTTVRRVTANTKSTPATRQAAVRIMLQWNSFEDHESLTALATDPLFKDDPTLQPYRTK